MRLPPYLSPSQLKLFEQNRELYYLKHLANARIPYEPQMLSPAVGSAFDAWVKSQLVHDLFGTNEPRLEFEALFEAQVEVQHRDIAKPEGFYALLCYRASGGYNQLLELLQQSSQPPKFEDKLQREIDGVPLLGKPDLYFYLDTIPVVLDWKVFGYCSKSTTSPAKYFQRCMDCWDQSIAKASKTHGNSHPGYTGKLFPITEVSGLEIFDGGFEAIDDSWAKQLSFYAWLLGQPVGGERFLLMVDQLTAKPFEPHPLLRWSHFVGQPSVQFQTQFFDRIKYFWNLITSGYFFDELTPEESKFKCEMLDKQAALDVATTDDDET